MADSDFIALLHEAERMATDIEGSEELPRVERTIGQVLEASQELHSRVTQTGAHDIQAHLLLGSKGIDLPQISQKLETLSARRTFEPLQPIADSDIESFLRNETENAILSVIEEVNKTTLQTVEDQKRDHMISEWNKEKIKLINAMIGPSQNWLDLKRCPERPQVADNITKFGRSMLGEQETAFAKQVYSYNKLVLQGAMRPSLDQKFASVAAEFNDPKVKEMWEILKIMVNIPALSRNEDPLRSRANPNVVRALITQGKKYLEDRYKTYMSSIVVDNLHSAQRGGIPGTYHLVKAFVGLRFQNGSIAAEGLADGSIEGRPLWPMIYYCLRSGDMDAAKQCIQQAGPGHEEFAEILEEKRKNPNQPLSNKLQTSVNFQYRIHVRNVPDPYKRAVYCILGCCDVNDEHHEVAKTADDYLWLKLCLIRESNPTNEEEILSYSDLQKTILEDYGENHYQAYEQPLVYFQVLALTAQFEPAIEFLSRITRYQVHAVHMAIALNELYLLGGPRNVQAPLLSVDTEDPVPLRRLNLARLILLYVRKFEVTDPSEALQYFYFLRNLKDPNGKNLFMVCVTDLATECRNYDALFGKIDPQTGIRSRGLVDQFNSAQINSEVIAANVGEELEKKGLFEDAINLFDIAGDSEHAYSLCCFLLSQVASEGGAETAGSAGALRSRLAILCDALAARSSASAIPTTVRSTFDTLRKLLIFFDHYHADNYRAAMESLAASGVVPLSSQDVNGCVSAFRSAGAQVVSVVPAVLRAAASLLLSARRRLPSVNLTHANKNELEFLKGQAEALTTFAGNIPYRMPADTYSQLTQMQILMQ